MLSLTVKQVFLDKAWMAPSGAAFWCAGHGRIDSEIEPETSYLGFSTTRDSTDAAKKT